jgi:uncharacterized membrane protein
MAQLASLTPNSLILHIAIFSHAYSNPPHTMPCVYALNPTASSKSPRETYIMRGLLQLGITLLHTVMAFMVRRIPTKMQG